MSRYLCQPYHDDGEWISEYDIVRKGKTLKLDHQEVFGRCGRECESIAFACDAVLEEYWEEIPEYLYSKMSTAKLQNKVCKSMCRTKRKKRIKFDTEWGAEEFQEIAPDQKQMFRQFVAGELYKKEKRYNGEYDEEKRQQDALQQYAEAYVDGQEAEKEHAAAKRRFENKKRARKGLPPLPEQEDEEEGDGAEAIKDGDSAANTGSEDEQRTEPKIQKIEL